MRHSLRHSFSFSISTSLIFNALALAVIIVALCFAPHSSIAYWGAAVTVAAGYPKRDFSLGRKSKIWKCSIANTGDILDTGLKNPSGDVEVDTDPTTVITAIARSIVNGQVRITFTTTGALANFLIRVTSRN